jgi:hypothetical protein
VPEEKMSKKPVKKKATKVEKPKDEPIAMASSPADPEPEKPKHFTLMKWHELDMYQCNHCSWSTLNPDEMVKHIAKHLAPEEPLVRRTDTGFVTATGDKIFREEVVGLSEDKKEV